MEKANIELTKHEIRKTVNAQDFKTIEKIAKKFDIDTTKYDKLQNGLKKMSLVNSIVGSVSRKIKKESWTIAAVKATVSSCIDVKKKSGRPRKMQQL